ncbi:MAG: hypothetical protein IJ404_04115 [Clostridia bacterium]|nr:hypothetical protein [Clostridia bacterium]
MKRILSTFLIIAMLIVTVMVGATSVSAASNETVVITDDYSWTLDNAEAGVSSTERIGIQSGVTVGTYEVVSQTTVPDGYIGIYTKADLDAVRNNLSGNYILMNDIEFTAADFAEGGAFYNGGVCWNPIGSENAPFTGIFDGNGYAVRNLLINISSSSHEAYAGMFEYSSGSIKNVGLDNATIVLEVSVSSSSVYACAGGIVAYNDQGTILNCYSTGNVLVDASSSDSNSYTPVVTYSGGIVGENDEGVILNCYNTGNVIVDASFSATNSGSNSDAPVHTFSGGIVGYSYEIATISNCYNIGNVKAASTFSSSIEKNNHATAHAGGIAGCFNGNISNCYNTGNVSAGAFGAFYVDASACSGGIVGRNWADVSNCYNTGSVNAEATFLSSAYVGGIAGRNVCTISNCYNMGDVNATACSSQYSTAEAFAGGIAGNHSTGNTISNCYNTGSVSAVASAYSPFQISVIANAYSGGIVGISWGHISNCYNTGSVNAEASASYSSPVSYDYYSELVARTYSGGIAGSNNGFISICYNTGIVSSSSIASDYDFVDVVYVYAYAGGISGYKVAKISDCYNTGSVSAVASSADSYAYAGGIVGENHSTSGLYVNPLLNCYNIGSVSANASTNAYFGGIVGNNGEKKYPISNCYYLNIADLGVGNGVDSCLKCTDSHMKNQMTYDGFDFEQIWTMEGDTSYPYPKLRNAGTLENKHTHSFKTTWEKDSTHHWHECSDCDERKDEGTHVFDNARDTTCNTCGYTRQVQTTPSATTKPSTTTPQTTTPPTSSTSKNDETTVGDTTTAPNESTTTAPDTTEPDVTVLDTTDSGNGKGNGKKDNTTVVIIIVASALALGGVGTAVALILKKKK